MLTLDRHLVTNAENVDIQTPSSDQRGLDKCKKIEQMFVRRCRRTDTKLTPVHRACITQLW